MIHYHAIVTGRVQGVGFRYFVQGEAVKRGMKGWVRNTDEGHVELKVEGEQQEVVDFLKTVRNVVRSALRCSRMSNSLRSDARPS
ncbi:acylphosphatase [Bacillus pumilus]|uniref:acylphosphatase n=1 Tax=Bacillus pumilus TaxID=1408 RepID=UPI003DA08687